MIDLHCHLLHGLDDGPAVIEESVRMLHEAKKIGIKTIITTLHIHRDIYWYNDEDVCQRFHELADRAEHLGIDLKIGYEVFIASVCKENIKQLVKNTLNHTEYMLIEIPYGEFPYQILESIYGLKKYKITPIIAHPERCSVFFRDYSLIKFLVDSGCLIQIDAASISGVYGRRAKYLSRKLIRQREAHYVASNAHFAGDYSEWYEKAYDTVVKWVGTEYAKRLFCDNADRIVQKNRIKPSKVIYIE